MEEVYSRPDHSHYCGSKASLNEQTLQLLENMAFRNIRFAFKPVISFSIDAQQIIEHLQMIREKNNFLQWFRCDKGPEFRAKAFVEFATSRRVKIHYIDPGKPFQNGFSERFIGKFTDECLVGANTKT